MEWRCNNCRRKKRHFFKVLIGDFSDELRLPPDFTKHIQVKEESGNASLRVCGGRTWQVELRKVDNRLVFRKGWSNFVVGNGLRTGDFLVFKHDRVLHFIVRVFDASACEKRRLPAGDTCRNAEMSNVSMSEGSLDCSSFKHSRGRVTGPQQDAWNAACSFKTKNPCFRKYFTDKTMCCRSYYLNVPSAFVRQHLAFESCMLTLFDPEGRCYPVRYLNTSESGGIVGFSSGWRKFAVENHLREGDACVFEFIKEPIGFKVHIFRGDKDGTEGER
ncbi:B3 domain-containing protein Os03g0212300-like [Nymphaea colorata]|nr:B3 domain-containing protein Os03g0212300-like [Nymphaea colorata]